MAEALRQCESISKHKNIHKTEHKSYYNLHASFIEVPKCYLDPHWPSQIVKQTGAGIEGPGEANKIWGSWCGGFELFWKTLASAPGSTLVSEPTLLLYKSPGGAPFSWRSLAGKLQICWNLVGAAISSSIDMWTFSTSRNLKNTKLAKLGWLLDII